MAFSIAVIGAGSWGTALAALLARNGHPVMLHCVPAETAKAISETRCNPTRFSDVVLPDNITATADISETLNDAVTAFLVVPTKFLRQFFAENDAQWQAWATQRRVLCNCTKGLLLDPTERTSKWLTNTLPGVDVCHLSGPNFAKEVIAGLPAAAVIAGQPAATMQVQALLMCDAYRLYTTEDTIGVEVAGFYKNVIAIAAGAIEELGLGQNTRAALTTRALTEMGRLVDYFGGQADTLIGLAGVGDLTLTCSSELSRNFQAGMRRARGQSLAQIQDEMLEVAEGVQASAAIHHWPEDHGLIGWPELPIAEEVYKFVHKDSDLKEAILRLMTRPAKAE